MTRRFQERSALAAEAAEIVAEAIQRIWRCHHRATSTWMNRRLEAIAVNKEGIRVARGIGPVLSMTTIPVWIVKPIPRHVLVEEEKKTARGIDL